MSENDGDFGSVANKITLQTWLEWKLRGYARMEGFFLPKFSQQNPLTFWDYVFGF